MPEKTPSESAFGDSPALAGVCLAGIAAFAAFRLATLGWNDPYPALTLFHWFEADEGWYTKSAQLLARQGIWSQPLDLTAWTHNPSYSLLLAGVFRLVGRGLWVARLFSVSWSALGAFWLYRICRHGSPRAVALLACLALVASFTDFSIARLARPYAMGTALCLLSLWIWVQHGGSRGVRACAASLGVAFAATTAKLFFAFGLVAVALLWVLEAGRHRRAGDRAEATRLVVSTGACLLVGLTFWLVLHAVARADWEAYEAEALSRHRLGFDRFDPLGLALHELGAFFYTLAARTRAPLLVIPSAIGAIVLVSRRLRRAPPPQVDRPSGSRGTTALAVWAAAGVATIGLSDYQPRRFFVFAIPALAGIACTLVGPVLGARRWTRGAAVLVAAHLAWQVPNYREFIDRPGRTDQVRIAKAVARRVTRDGPETLLGRLSASVSLHDARIRPVEIGFLEGQPYGLCDRLAHHRPGYLVVDGSDAVASRLETECPTLVRAVKVVGRYRPRTRSLLAVSPIVLVGLEYRTPARGAL